MTDDTTSDSDFRMMQVTHDHLLDEAVKITQPADGYRVGTDTVLLAAAISTAGGRVLDLGAGVGGVSLCLAHRHHELQITAIEKHADLAALAQENADVNGVANRLRILTTDIRELPSVLAGSFDHVVSNPPYHNSHGTRPRDASQPQGSSLLLSGPALRFQIAQGAGVRPDARPRAAIFPRQ